MHCFELGERATRQSSLVADTNLTLHIGRTKECKKIMHHTPKTMQQLTIDVTC